MKMKLNKAVYIQRGVKRKDHWIDMGVDGRKKSGLGA
jgi:hypothetical protein